MFHFDSSIQVISFINSLQQRNVKKDIIYYEIGIGTGSTVSKVAKLLNNSGKIYIFSKDQECKKTIEKLNTLGYHNIYATNCSDNKIYSGYHFDIAQAFLKNNLPLFDVAYLDGGHVFHLDAPTTCIMKELCGLGGVIFFDDYYWTIETSPTLNPNIRPQTLIEYDEQQIKMAHIKMICDIFMETDIRFNKINIYTDSCVAYQKVKHYG